MRPVLLSFFILAYSLPAFTQQISKVDLDSLLEEFIFVHPSFPPPEFFDTSYIPQILPFVPKYFNSKDEDTRFKAYFTYSGLCRRSKNDKIKAKIPEMLLMACQDSSYMIRDYFSKQLHLYPKSDLSKDFIAAFKAVIHNPEYVNFYNILTIGYLNLTEERSYIQTFLDDDKRNVSLKIGDFKTIDWAARLALARMGDKSQIEYVARAITEQESEYYTVVSLLRYLSYVRCSETVDIIIDYLYSEEELPPYCSPGEHYALRALEILSRIIKDFPTRQTYSYGYKTEDVLLARQWMQEHRNDYELSFDSFY